CYRERHAVALSKVTPAVVTSGRSDDVDKQDGDFDILAHECVMIIRIRERSRPATNGLRGVPVRESPVAAAPPPLRPPARLHSRYAGSRAPRAHRCTGRACGG